jgi:nucleotide-binding universal stress UspA family protein
MWDRCLLAIDQSESGRAAVEFTARLAGESASDVRVFHVRELPANMRAIALESPSDAQLVVEDALSYLRFAGIGAEGRFTSARDDSVAQRIVQEASEWDCNVIILGSRRLRGFGRLAGHGVRERVLRLSPLPVITAPTPVREEAL